MSLDSNEGQFLFTEKYRPKTINDCILPEAIKKTFHEYVATGTIPTLLLCGGAGVGKTTIAKALCNETGAEYILVNGSDEGRSIDVLRTTIRGFASTISLTGAKKVVIIDEFDYANAQSVQPALRSFIEEFSNNCTFIFTANYKNRIIEPLQSRCAVIEFKIGPKDKPELAAQFFKRASAILKQENVTFQPKVLAEVITKYFPDYRRVLNELQRYSSSGTIDAGILVNLTEESFKDLINNLKSKNFTNVRKWVSEHAGDETTSLFRELYDTAFTHIDQNSIPQLILILAEYQYKAAFVADAEINTMAALTEIMSTIKFK